MQYEHSAVWKLGSLSKAFTKPIPQPADQLRYRQIGLRSIANGVLKPAREKLMFRKAFKKRAKLVHINATGALYTLTVSRGGSTYHALVHFGSPDRIVILTGARQNLASAKVTARLSPIARQLIDAIVIENERTLLAEKSA